MRSQGDQINELRVGDYVQLASNGLITNEKTLASNPDLVKRIVTATLKGLADTIANPDEAYTISEKYVPNLTSANAVTQKQVLSASIDLWKTNRLGYSDPQSWQNMQNTLLKMGLLKQPLDLTKAFTNEFIP